MDDFPQDELDDFSSRITLSSSVLVALSSLNPPSPILTPSQLTFTWSSGDIPVVLFNDAYATDGRALTPTSTTNVSVPNRNSCPSSHGVSIGTPDFKQTQVPSHRNSRIESYTDGHSFHASGSSDTLASVGTFGPRRNNLKLCGDFPEIPLPTSRAVDYERRDTTITRDHARGSSGKTLTDTGALETLTSQSSSETLKAFAPSGIDFTGSDQTTALKTRPGDIITCKHESYQLPKIPETLASDRTASWIHSQEWNSPQQQNYGFPEIISLVNRASTGIQTLTSSVAPIRHRILTDHNLNLVTDSSSPSLPQIRREHQRHKSHHHADTSYTKHFRQPKEHFAWLQDITVRILIDQEGFRSAQPSFKLSGIVHLRTLLEPQTPGPEMAQFRPITRRSFHFHHAAFENPPILRRVTTNDQETHDYVSRQAHLTLKYNGVYVVHGHEITAVGHDGHAQKLLWQFEYLVDDRRIDVSGRVIEGEKILTPLTFSCSPGLLLPAQAKRINIMHVFKKGVAPKLSAEKLRPPGTTSTLNDGPESSPGAPSWQCKTDIHHDASHPGKNHGWSLHRRVQSHGTRRQDGHKSVNNRAGIPTSGTSSHRTRTAIEYVSEDEFGRHRRASSVGNHSQGASYRSMILRNGRQDASIKDNTVPSTFPPPSRHIIPPSRLAELFDTTEFSRPGPTTSLREPTTFTSLTPRPGSRHGWRGNLGRDN